MPLEFEIPNVETMALNDLYVEHLILQTGDINGIYIGYGVECVKLCRTLIRPDFGSGSILLPAVGCKL